MFKFGKKNKEVDSKENEKSLKNEKKLSTEELESISAGGAFSDIPRVPTKPIDDNLKDKV